MDKFQDNEDMAQAISGVEERVKKGQEKLARAEKRRLKGKAKFNRSLLLAVLSFFLVGLLVIQLVLSDTGELSRTYMGVTFLWLLVLALLTVARRQVQKHR